MHPNPILKSAIEKGDIISARAVILSSFRKARNEQDYQFISWVDFAEQQFNGKNESFFVEDDGITEFSDNDESWSSDLWKTLRVEIEYNFSRKKLDHIITLMNHLRSIGHPDFQIKTPPIPLKSKQMEKDNPTQAKHFSPSNKQLKTGLIAGAAVGFAIGMVIGRPIIGSALGAAIGGGVGNLVDGSKTK